MSRQPLTKRDRLRVQALRADAWIQMKEPARAVELMTQRESWLNRQRDIEMNREQTLAGLKVSNRQALRESADLHRPRTFEAG